MRVRGLAKRLLFGTAPFFRGRFRYYGQVVYFPLGSSTFERACEEGIYEREVTNLILALAKPGTTYFDVGANIGLLSVPVLSVCPTVKVVSIEASPDTLPFLRKTQLSGSALRQLGCHRSSRRSEGGGGRVLVVVWGSDGRI